MILFTGMRRLNSSFTLNYSTTRSNLSDWIPNEQNISSGIIIQSVFLALVIIVGVVANSLVCLVIYKRRNLHTVLYSFLVSLSVSDLLHSALKMPTTMLSTLHIR